MMLIASSSPGTRCPLAFRREKGKRYLIVTSLLVVVVVVTIIGLTGMGNSGPLHPRASVNIIIII